MKLNDKLEILKKEFDENKNSHVFLVETNDSELCLLEIKKIISKLIDENSDIIANQVNDENYLELIILRPDGKFIKKEQIFSLQERLKTKPILSDKIFYIIMDADMMNDTSSNKLLKTIEEPNENVIGFLIAKNVDTLLPTIKSRCEIITINFDKKLIKEDEENGIDEIVKKLIYCIEKGDLLEYNIFKNDNKDIKDNGKLVVKMLKEYYDAALNLIYKPNFDEEIITFIKKSNNNSELIAKVKYLNITLNKLVFNMNIDLLLEKIFLELKEVKTNANSGNQI